METKNEIAVVLAINHATKNLQKGEANRKKTLKKQFFKIRSSLPLKAANNNSAEINV